MAGNSESARTASVLHVIPVGTSLLEKDEFCVTVENKRLVANLPAIKNTLKGLEDRRRGLHGTDKDPIKAFESPTLEQALDALTNKFSISQELGHLKRVYEVLCLLDPKVELERRLHPDNKPKDRLPAELSSLYLFYGQMMEEKGVVSFQLLPETKIKDDVFLLATDTMAGAFCACCLRNYLQESKVPLYPFIRDVRLTVVGGLQVEDADLFAQKGIDHLKAARDAAVTWASQQGHQAVYLNVTGGYKGVLPIISVLGLAKRWSLYYAYEDSSKRINVKVKGATVIDLELDIRSTPAPGASESSLL